MAANSRLWSRAENLAQINALIARSKAHWYWPEEYLQHALPLLRLTADYLKRTHGFEILTNTLAAFFFVHASDSPPLLDNLWVAPEFIGKGVGTPASKHIYSPPRQRSWSEVSVVPDPPSEGFYAKMGFSDAGERVPSRVPDGPVFSVYRIRITIADQPSS